MLGEVLILPHRPAENAGVYNTTRHDSRACLCYRTVQCDVIALPGDCPDSSAVSGHSLHAIFQQAESGCGSKASVCVFTMIYKESKHVLSYYWFIFYDTNLEAGSMCIYCVLLCVRQSIL